MNMLLTAIVASGAGLSTRLFQGASALIGHVRGGMAMSVYTGSFLKHARESNDPNLRYLAYTKLADPKRTMWGVRSALWDQRQPVEATKMNKSGKSTQEAEPWLAA